MRPRPHFYVRWRSISYGIFFGGVDREVRRDTRPRHQRIQKRYFSPVFSDQGKLEENSASSVSPSEVFRRDPVSERFRREIALG